MTRMTLLTVGMGVAVMVGFGGTAMAQCCGVSAPKAATTASVAEAEKPQTKCPVMGGKIKKSSYVDVKGYRVYTCCPGCISKIKADPDKYLAKIRANGETPEKLPAADSKDADKKG